MKTNHISFAVALASGALLAASPSVAAKTVLHCAIHETVTGSNGKVQYLDRDKIIKLAEGEYRTWSSQDASWSENQCSGGSCHFERGVFNYLRTDSARQDAYIYGHKDRMRFDSRTGRLSAETIDSSTLIVTGYEVETTTIDNGECHNISDPTAARRY